MRLTSHFEGVYFTILLYYYIYFPGTNIYKLYSWFWSEGIESCVIRSLFSGHVAHIDYFSAILSGSGPHIQVVSLLSRSAPNIALSPCINKYIYLQKASEGLRPGHASSNRSIYAPHRSVVAYIISVSVLLPLHWCDTTGQGTDGDLVNTAGIPKQIWFLVPPFPSSTVRPYVRRRPLLF